MRLIVLFLLILCLFTSGSSISDIGSRHLLQSSIAQQYLIPHNRVRAILGLPPLRWSATLANFASWWANSNYGENIFWGAGGSWKPGDAVNAWAAQGRYYNYASNSCSARDCLHYTQMVWRRSSKVGCAKVVCFNGGTFITCNYDPHGNVIGQRPF